ncbi:hypothetical protein SUGI_0620720 [Cryptomeria japonica]|nr:hypothetical protein SUGI_0620720 [Cryptomeria japonica]
MDACLHHKVVKEQQPKEPGKRTCSFQFRRQGQRNGGKENLHDLIMAAAYSEERDHACLPVSPTTMLAFAPRYDIVKSIKVRLINKRSKDYNIEAKTRLTTFSHTNWKIDELPVGGRSFYRVVLEQLAKEGIILTVHAFWHKLTISKQSV